LLARARKETQPGVDRENPFNTYLRAGQLIRGGIQLANSIDDFIDLHQDNEPLKLCGKLAIVRSILEAEGKSKLRITGERPRLEDFTAMADAWLVKLFKLLTRGVPKARAASAFSNVAFINFNYDRLP
jgi:hypothetical protein